MAQCSHIGEEDADLTVLHLAAGTTILRRDASRVAAPFGKAAFINDEHGEDLRGCRRGGEKRGGGQGLADKGAQFIADAGFVPDGVRERAVYASQPPFSGPFTKLPATF